MKLMLLAVSLAATYAALAPAVAHADERFASMPRVAWAEADPADSLYRAARRSLAQKEYEAAARAFDAIVTRYPRSEYAPDALYWKGFALYRNGNLEEAEAALEAQARRYPKATTRNDAAALLIQVKGQLARRGDTSAQAAVTRAASQSVQGCDDMEMQAAALDAVQRMNADRVLPLLRRVLARRDPCSKPLRKNALFILAQRGGGDRERILLEAAKTDPDPGVRQDAVFHLQQAKSDAAVDALEDLLLHSDETRLRQNALFALAQNHSERARRILRAFALSDTEPLPLRNDAVFHLSQSGDAGDQAWLREAFGKISDPKLRSDVMFHIAQSAGPEASRWLATVVTDTRESDALRKNALFHLSQRKLDGREELIGLYDKVSVPLRKEIIFHLAQRNEPASLDKLIDIAKRDPVPELRKEALFHISHSNDPKALKTLEEIAAP
ncbi:MAG TPA: HEAT repeat domain-containing protein [Gemmatimonadaceae bacterium]|nr:HEAT repeat domain-containing protein [Gemmatimonadaceae bacterium]